MFASLPATFTFASLLLLAVATPNEKRWATPTTTVSVAPPAQSGSPCSTDEIQCCESTESSDSADGVALLDLLGIVVDGVDVLLGVNCSPISVIGAGGGTCKANTVCCEDNSFGSLVSIGCVPVSL